MTADLAERVDRVAGESPEAKAVRPVLKRLLNNSDKALARVTVAGLMDG